MEKKMETTGIIWVILGLYIGSKVFRCRLMTLNCEP